MEIIEKMICKRKKCEEEIMIPLKIIAKGTGVVVVARCFKCKKSQKFLFPLDTKEQWLPELAPLFLSCDVCGADNLDNWEYVGTSYDFWTPRPYYRHGFGMHHPFVDYSNLERLKIGIKCKNCGKKRTKVISSELWSDLKIQTVDVKNPPQSQLKCPHCNADISKGEKVCHACKVEIVCDKCGMPIAPLAKFCSNCGDPVSKIEPPIEIDSETTHICPTCHEVHEKSVRFCYICGQELICDKCGKDIQEGASFCTFCGDPVEKGELSE